MKNLRKIIGLFTVIFLIGIYLTVLTINTSLNKPEETEEIVKVKKDTILLLKAEEKVNAV